MTDKTPTQALIDECLRQQENCAYTSTSFIVWLRALRWIRTALLVLPVIFGALATWQIVTQTSPLFAAVFTLLATVLPPVYAASRIDQAITDYESLAGEFTNLRDRFRQLATIASHKPFPEFEAEARPMIERLEAARSRALAPPEWYFRKARKKMTSGDYRHDLDEQRNV
jgi:hypothetical protein